MVRHEGRSQLAHRVAYCEFHGITIARIKGLIIRHECDNRRCVEPLHLRVGTQSDNVADMMARGRNSPPPRMPGGIHPMAKLSYEDVAAIRRARLNGAKNTDLARTYNVTPTTIGHIVNGKTWSDPVCDINAAIAPLAITADGLAQLGIQPVGTERAAKLYASADMPHILNAIASHINSAAREARWAA